jgi:phosphate transport system substrate-binding protein
MKQTAAVIMLGLLLPTLYACQKHNSDNMSDGALSGTITISGAWALYPMAVRWAEEFQKLHPKAHLDIAAGGAGKGMADALAGVVDLGGISREVFPSEMEKGAWWVSVTKDAVVPVANESNPLIDEVLSCGLTVESARGIWITGDIKDWNTLTGLQPNESSHKEIHTYTRSDACGAAQTWAAYLAAAQEDLMGVGVYGDPGLLEAVKKDPLGIGYNNLNYVYDGKTKKQMPGVRVIPLDLNCNGSVDDTESFYENRDSLVEAIGAGIYPSPPARDLHFVSHGKPTRTVVVEFIRWVLTDGQRFVDEAGYIRLGPEKLHEQLQKLN